MAKRKKGINISKKLNVETDPSDDAEVIHRW